MSLNQRDALRLKYDTPIDRIAARLLWKDPNFVQLPEMARRELDLEPPRIRPEDVTDIFGAPPDSGEKEKTRDHRGEKWGMYLILGHAGFKRHYERSPLALHGGYKARCGVNPSGPTRSSQWRGKAQGSVKIHHWWVRAPDGTVESIKWNHLRSLLPGESVHDKNRRKIIAKGREFKE